MLTTKTKIVAIGLVCVGILVGAVFFATAEGLDDQGLIVDETPARVVTQKGYEQEIGAVAGEFLAAYEAQADPETRRILAGEARDRALLIKVPGNSKEFHLDLIIALGACMQAQDGAAKPECVQSVRILVSP